MSSRDTAELKKLSSQAFLDDLTASKNDQLRNTLNSGIAGNAPVGGPVSRRTRNPQTLEETREEIAQIEQQNALSEEGYKVAISNYQTKQLMKFAPFLIIAWLVFK